MNNSEIIFDEKTGISIEEQQEILTQINGIAEKNRQSLSAAAAEKVVVHAKKNSAIFPIIINMAAVFILVIGAALLIFFNSRIDAQVRTGNAVFNITERALIEEIRKNTAEEIAAKEYEISSIASRLEDVDNELLQLYSSNQELTAEQRATQNRLLTMQNAFREELSMLQDERSQILENSRSREARLRAQLDERTREFAAAQQKTASELDSAINELEKLTNERDRIAAVNALLSGGIAAAQEQMQRGQFEQTDQFDLMAKNAQLQDTITEMQKTIDALGSGGSGLTRRINELENTISNLQQSSAEKDNKISTLEQENTSFSSTVTGLRTANSTQEQEIANLRNQLTVIRQALQEN